MVKRAAPPILGGLALVGAPVFEQAVLRDAVVAPANGASLVHRVERVDQRDGAGEAQPRSRRLRAEPVQQLGFRNAPQALPDQPGRDPLDSTVAHGRPTSDATRRSAPRRRTPCRARSPDRAPCESTASPAAPTGAPA